MVSLNDVRLLQSHLEGIGLPHQAEELDGVQATTMSAQITQLTRALVAYEEKEFLNKKT